MVRTLKLIDRVWTEEWSEFVPEENAPELGRPFKYDPTFWVAALYPDYDKGVTEVVYHRTFRGMVVTDPEVAEALRLVMTRGNY